MVIRQISKSTVKISLTAGELSAYQVTFSELERKTSRTLRLLSDAAVKAEAKTGLPFCTARLFVEAFSRSDGGCLLYLSVISMTENQTEQKDPVRPIVIYEFSSPHEIYQCCARLSETNAIPIRSALYARRSQGSLRLVAELSPDLHRKTVAILSEFGTAHDAERLKLAQTAEHYICISKQDAVSEIAAWERLL
ncbi:MAG: adaptor protein MecA [Ruminococcus sp.]|nr:adaptor protein MecA [Ruminococcus sp.]